MTIKHVSVMTSFIVACLFVFAWIVSHHLNFAVCWGLLGVRYDIDVVNGEVLVRRLHKFPHTMAPDWGIFAATTSTPAQVKAFQQLAWWHVDNSWWEGVGYTVHQRWRFGSFESASGDYWPPFIWQLPHLPFDIHTFPCWAGALLFSVAPLVQLIAWWRSHRPGSRPVVALPIPA